MGIVVEEKCIVASVSRGFDLGMPPAALTGLHGIHAVLQLDGNGSRERSPDGKTMHA
jgi:hypothetical protein